MRHLCAAPAWEVQIGVVKEVTIALHFAAVLHSFSAMGLSFLPRCVLLAASLLPVFSRSLVAELPSSDLLASKFATVITPDPSYTPVM